MQIEWRAGRRAATRDVVLILLAVVLLAAAAALALRGRQLEIPDDAASAIAFTCRACGQDFSLTARQVHEAMINFDPRLSASGGGPAGMPCTHCGKRAGERKDDEPDAPPPTP